MGFFAIMNPIASIPIFLTLTEDDDLETTQMIAFRSVLTAFVIVLIFSVAGHLILKVFSINFTALRLTGGILVLLIGYDMLQGKNSTYNRPSKETIEKTKDEEVAVAFAPLGTPLLAGPGVIITAMNFAGNGMINLIITNITFAMLCVATYFSFMYGKKIKRLVGASALKVITRMMGLILAVIGMQMLVQGIYSAIREFSL